jgi:hypothetical protein
MILETTEQTRRAALIAAEKQAEALLAEIEAAGLVAAGRSETEVEDDIGALALARFGIERHWHRRIVRAGPNTLTTAWDYPPARIIAPDDTVYVDLGPVFEEWEADIGRTYALGSDPAKNKLVADLPRVFARVQSHYNNSPESPARSFTLLRSRRRTKRAGPSAARSPATSSANSPT